MSDAYLSFKFTIFGCHNFKKVSLQDEINMKKAISSNWFLKISYLFLIIVRNLIKNLRDSYPDFEKRS